MDYKMELPFYDNLNNSETERWMLLLFQSPSQSPPPLSHFLSVVYASPESFLIEETDNGIFPQDMEYTLS